jgi:hypothetical protein
MMAACMSINVRHKVQAFVDGFLKNIHVTANRRSRSLRSGHTLAVWQSLGRRKDCLRNDIQKQDWLSRFLEKATGIRSTKKTSR